MQRYIVRVAPEVLLAPALAAEVASLAEGLKKVREGGSGVAGIEGLAFAGYVGTPATEFLSWRALGRLARAALVIAGLQSPTLRKIAEGQNADVPPSDDPVVSAVVAHVSNKLGIRTSDPQTAEADGVEAAEVLRRALGAAASSSDE